MTNMKLKVFQKAILTKDHENLPTIQPFGSAIQAHSKKLVRGIGAVIVLF